MNQKIEIKMFEIYDNIINIELFNDIVTFVMFTTNKEKDKNELLNFLEEKHIWFQRKLNYDVQFKYLGELLERYKDRIGTDIKDIRAIALALAYSKEFVTQRMIVDTQKIDFINEIEKLAKDDIYLKATLYLYDNKKYYNFIQELKERKYQKTEEMIFVLSIYEDFNEGFNIFKEQIKELLGATRTVSVFNNIGIYNWIIKNIYPIINKNRKKDIELFRALTTIPTALIKEGSKTYNVLINNKYSKEEIAYLNYVLLHYKPVPNTVRMGRSIVEEKIVLNMCEVLINSENSYSKNIYDYLEEVIKKYWNFDIKCYGYERIKDALNHSLKIKNPRTFIELYRIFDNKIFLFDILEDKWDIVATEFEKKDYRELFDNYLLFSDLDKEKIAKSIKKYEELTKGSYLSSFKNCCYGRNGIFSKLVEKEIIDLKEYFIEYNNRKEQENIDLDHLKYYVSKIDNKKSFLFLKYFLQEHDIKETDEYGFDLRRLYNVRGYYSGRSIDIERTFLNSEENKELFSWVNEYAFKATPELYIDFVVEVLKNKYLSTILSKEERRNIYLTIIKVDDSIYEDRSLRQKYLTKQELEEQENKEKEEKRQRELLRKQEKENEIKQQFADITEFTFKNIYNFYYYSSWDSETQDLKAKIIIEYLNKHLKEHKFIEDEIIYFNQICNKLLEQKAINIQLYKSYIMDYIKEGRIELCKQY